MQHDIGKGVSLVPSSCLDSWIHTEQLREVWDGFTGLFSLKMFPGLLEFFEWLNVNGHPAE